MKRAVGILMAVLVAHVAGSCFAQGSNAPAAKQEEKKTAATQQQNTVVLIKTSMGNIKVELFDTQAPETVKNFLQYVDAKFYEGTIFHRVVDTALIQGGGFTKELVEKPAKQPIKNEASVDRKNLRGTIAMARKDKPDSATCQFFINVMDNDRIFDKDTAQDKIGYCVFGKVIEGMDVVDKIKSVKTGGHGRFKKELPIEDVIIKEVSRVK
jgi:cyclophilin family peptidyl-prolyl cis-trans isomerase